MEEVYQASAVGVFRMVLIIVFVMVLLRIIGKVLVARRNIQEDHNIKAKQRNKKKAQEASKRNLGKVTVVEDTYNKSDYVDYEEVK
jgi:uncharacterized membrane protein